jgi:lipopolysaccharide/colanic/teichoic acid biosynthesis glycosyltransferase
MSRALKRLLDIVAALAALLLLWPVMLVIAVLVRIKMGAPVLFRQQRPGLHARPFTFYKFRTMAAAAAGADEVATDQQRLTPLGRTLRAWTLDELPQFWNVLRGDVSLVGPRPLLMQYLPRYTPEQARRHEVKPGLTGWAQVNGRNALTWEEKFQLDVWYVDHWSLVLDAKILWRTLASVIKKEGIAQPGHATMPEFMGSPRQ